MEVVPGKKKHKKKRKKSKAIHEHLSHLSFEEPPESHKEKPLTQAEKLVVSHLEESAAEKLPVTDLVKYINTHPPQTIYDKVFDLVDASAPFVDVATGTNPFRDKFEDEINQYQHEHTKLSKLIKRTLSKGEQEKDIRNLYRQIYAINAVGEDLLNRFQVEFQKIKRYKKEPKTKKEKKLYLESLKKAKELHKELQQEHEEEHIGHGYKIGLGASLSGFH